MSGLDLEWSDQVFRLSIGKVLEVLEVWELNTLNVFY